MPCTNELVYWAIMASNHGELCMCVAGIYGTCIKATSLSIWRSAWAWRHSPGSAFYSTSTSGENSSRRQLSSLCCLCIFSLLVSLLSLMHTRRHTFSGVCLVYYVVYVNPQSPSLSALALVSYQIYLFLLTLVSSCCIDALLRIHTLCCCTCELTILYRIAIINFHFKQTENCSNLIIIRDKDLYCGICFL